MIWIFNFEISKQLKIYKTFIIRRNGPMMYKVVFQQQKRTTRQEALMVYMIFYEVLSECTGFYLELFWAITTFSLAVCAIYQKTLFDTRAKKFYYISKWLAQATTFFPLLRWNKTFSLLYRKYICFFFHSENHVKFHAITTF